MIVGDLEDGAREERELEGRRKGRARRGEAARHRMVAPHTVAAAPRAAPLHFMK